MLVLSITIGENSQCLLDNRKIIDGQSSGVNTSQIKNDKEFLTKKAIIKLIANNSTCPVLKFCTKVDTVLSVCLNQQLQLDDLVAKCVSQVLTEDKFCQSLPVVSRAL